MALQGHVQPNQSNAALKDVFYDVAGNAAVHLEHARELQPQIPPEWRALLLPAVLGKLRAIADDKATGFTIVCV